MRFLLSNYGDALDENRPASDPHYISNFQHIHIFNRLRYIVCSNFNGTIHF